MSEWLPPLPPKMRSLSLAWLREEDWPRWLAIDPNFQPDYQHWLRRMEAALKHYEGQGKRVVKVIVDPDEFLEWSRVNGGKVDSGARATFAARLAIKNASH